jgi:hypothetical protein
MPILMTSALLATMLLAGCSTPASQPAARPTPGRREVKIAGVSFSYSDGDFDEVQVEKEPKLTAQENGENTPEGVAPEHSCFVLKDKRPLPALEKGPRYFYPTQSFICVIPLKDSSVKDFGRAYPRLQKAALDLRKILRERPERIQNWREIPDLPDNNASPSIFSRPQYLDFRSGSGILFLTQYTQELDPNPVNNEELTCNFQGLTSDGRYYVAARLAITHPSLPKGIDYTDDIERDRGHRYLRGEEKALEGLAEESFQPPLNNLKALLASIVVE